MDVTQLFLLDSNTFQDFPSPKTSRNGAFRLGRLQMNHSKYLCISAGASIGSLMAIFVGVDPTDVMPIFTAIMVGLVVAFVLESKSEKGSDEN